MTIEKILNTVYPVTKAHRQCRFKMQKLQYQRDRLKDMIEAYSRGEVVNFEPLKISIDLGSILEKFKN